ncbi:MAG: hypothetical protein Q8R83_05750 [Legionellaceae bacterium]|nr:hypothetical protein [Legionellaceae bacterium]
MKFKEIFTEKNIFTNDLRRSAFTQNPTPIPEIDLVYVLSARTTALGEIADIELLQHNKRQEDEFDLVDDIHRMRLGIQIAIQVCALRAGKNTEELTDDDYVIPIFYNGRKIHNEDLKKALLNPELQKQLGKDPLPYYPARLFTISAIYNPRKNTMEQNTVAQAQSFRNYLEYHSHEHIAVVSSAFHLPRVARTLGLDSPQMDEASLEEELVAKICEWRSSPSMRDKANLDRRKTEYANPIDNLKLYLFGVHKNEARSGIKLDLIGENNAMQQYTADATPSISRYLSKNVFFTDIDVFSYKSLAKAISWSRYSSANDTNIEIEDTTDKMAI